MDGKPAIWVSLVKELNGASRLRTMRIHFHADRCIGTWQCYEVCPVGCWKPDGAARKPVFHGRGLCIACGACVLQCPEDAIELS